MATLLSTRRREMYTYSLPKQVELVRKGFVQYVRYRQAGVFGHFRTASRNASAKASFSAALIDDSDAAQLPTNSAVSATLTVQSTLGSFFQLPNASPEARGGFWWLPEVNAARRYVKSLPELSGGADENRDLLLKRLFPENPGSKKVCQVANFLLSMKNFATLSNCLLRYQIMCYSCYGVN